jgi:hypothetical protein
MEADKIVFAESTVTVHKILGTPIRVGKETYHNVESITLEPGDTFNFNDLPTYQQNALLNEGIEGLQLLEQEEITRRLEERERVLGLADTLQVSL